jgi:hypothetical protein
MRARFWSRNKRLEEGARGRADAEPEMLYYLAERARPQTAAKSRPIRLHPAEANRFLADDADPEVRAELAQKWAGCFPIS